MVDKAFWAGITSALFFVVLNVAMNIYTKFLFNEHFRPWTVLTIQQIQTFMVLYPMLGVMKRRGWEGAAQETELAFIHFLQVFLVTLLFCVNVGLNSLSLVEISITLNQTVRAFLPVGVLGLGFCFETKPYHWTLYVTTSVVVLGIGITCWGSPNFKWYGFSLAFISTLVAAVGTSLNGKLLSDSPFSRQGPYGVVNLTLVQSVPAMFIFALIAFSTERSAVADMFDLGDTGRFCKNIVMVSCSSLIALCSNLGRCFLIAATNPLTETLAGNAKVALLCIIDSLLFGTHLLWRNYLGITLTFSGFSLHLLLQYASKNANEESPNVPQSPQKRTAVNRPRLISAAETGLASEHLAYESREHLPPRRIGGENGLNSIPEVPRLRSSTWPQPYQEPVNELDFSTLWAVPVWLKLQQAHEEYSPNSVASLSPAARRSVIPTYFSGPMSPTGSARSRFYSDPTDTNNNRSRLREDVRLGKLVEEEEEMRNLLPENNLGGPLLQPGELDRDMSRELELKPGDVGDDFGYL